MKLFGQSHKMCYDFPLPQFNFLWHMAWRAAFVWVNTFDKLLNREFFRKVPSCQTGKSTNWRHQFRLTNPYQPFALHVYSLLGATTRTQVINM